MSQKPIFVATHPRACSTAFERVFMTRRDTIQCVHEPFGDAFYYGPERLGTRFADDEQARIESGFSQSTYKTVMDRIEREASEGKRVFIKDILHYLLPPNGKPASIAPSLQRRERGVGTETNGSVDTVANGTNGHVESGHGVNQTSQKHPYPYNTESEPGNPMVMPKELLSKFHFAFLIRDPHFSVPSYYRCTIPPLDKVTGFYYYDPAEAGYDELRRAFDYMRSIHMIGPHIATREQDADEIDNKLRPVVNGVGEAHESAEICVIDADDLLEKPGPMIEAFCRSVGLEYDPSMLDWKDPAEQQQVCEAFEKWRGFHNDAIESDGLKARAHRRPMLSEDEFNAEWTKKYGAEGAALIRRSVDECMADYLYLKQFVMKV